MRKAIIALVIWQQAVFLALLLMRCATAPAPVPEPPAPAPDASVAPVDAGDSHCDTFCEKCASRITPEGASCILSCQRLLEGVGGAIDVSCMTSALNCDETLKCIK